MTTETLLHYDAPAENFNQALPVGNGRIGAMVFGKSRNELIRLNEDSIWSGGLRHRINPDALEGLEEVRSLIRQGDIPAAEKIAFEKLQGVSPNSRHYMPLGDLSIDMDLPGKAKEYCRQLDLSDAVTECSFTADGIRFTRSVFASAPDQVIVIKISADQPGAVSLCAGIDGRDDYYDDNRPCDPDIIRYTGGTGSRDGIFFAACLGCKSSGGSMRTLGGKVTVKNADEVMLVISVRTSFYTDDFEEAARADARAALNQSADELYRRHADDYRELFGRVELNLCNNSTFEAVTLTTDKRISRLKGDELDTKDCERLIHDNKLIELYFNFGRYLMISASRPGTQPMNLQGIWNEDMWPAWGSRYTVLI